LLTILMMASALGAQDRVMVHVGQSAIHLADMQDEARYWRLSGTPDDGLERVLISMIDRRLLLEFISEVRLEEEEKARALTLADAAMASFVRQYGGMQELDAALTVLEWNLMRLREFLELRAGDNLRLRRYVESRVQVTTDEDVAALRKALEARGQSTRYFSVRQIVLKAGASPDGRREAKRRALAAMLEIERGRSFQEVCTEFSQDEVTARIGGEMGRLSDKEVRPEVLAVLEKLEPNEVSPPIETPDGYVLMEVTDRRDAADLLDGIRFSEARLATLKEARTRLKVDIVDEPLRLAGFAEKYAEHVNNQNATPPFSIERLDLVLKDE